MAASDLQAGATPQSLAEVPSLTLRVQAMREEPPLLPLSRLQTQIRVERFW
jgi:hypothetical protein